MNNYILPNYNRINLKFLNGKGSWLYTKNDKYLDFSSGIAVNCLGHSNTKLIKALNSKPSSLAIITDSKNKGLETIQKNLIELNIDKYYEFWLCEELNLENERIRKLTNLSNPILIFNRIFINLLEYIF